MKEALKLSNCNFRILRVLKLLILKCIHTGLTFYSVLLFYNINQIRLLTVWYVEYSYVTNIKYIRIIQHEVLI